MIFGTCFSPDKRLRPIKYNTFLRTIKEMFKHEETCTNPKCEENGWNTLKVVDLECIGLTQDAFLSDQRILENRNKCL